MSQISLKSISGITSITTPAGVDNRFSLYNFDSTERLVLDHSGNLNISGVSTATNFKTGSSNLHSTGLTVGDSFVHSTGINLGTGVTFSKNGNVSIGGTLELFNTTGNASNNPSEIKISNLTISQHNNTGTYKLNNSSFGGEILLSAGGGGFGGLSFWNSNFSSLYFQARDQGSIKLFHNNTVRFETSGIGATVYGNLDVNADLDVDGHTNLDNVSIAGVVTATTFVGSGALLTGIVGGKFNGPAAGIVTTSTVGIQTADVTSADLVGAATSMIGLYIGDGHLLFSNYLNKSGGYYITTGLNALNAGPVTLGSTMTLDGSWVIV